MINRKMCDLSVEGAGQQSIFRWGPLAPFADTGHEALIGLSSDSQ